MDKFVKSRSANQKKVSFIIFFIAICIGIIIYYLEENRINSLLDLLTDKPCMHFLVVILACVSYVLFGALCFCSVFVYWEEANERNWPILSSRIIDYVDFKTGCSFIFVLVTLCSCKENVNSFSDVWDIILPLILLTLFALSFASINNLVFDYDDVDLSKAQSSERSIGALWAVGAYEAYFKLTLKDMIQKIKAYETKHDVSIPVKKLLILCPLSCDVNGTFSDKDDRIITKGHLEPLECDQGANINRSYKHSVYEIKDHRNEDSYVVAEFPSSLGTLWEMRQSMNAEMLRYHRDCFIKTLKDLLRTYPCIVLEYDDNAVPLHQILLSAIPVDQIR